jgi:hypothetical protein
VCGYGCGIYILGVETLTREIRAIEYHRRVVEKRRIKAMYQMVLTELILVFVSILLLFEVM